MRARLHTMHCGRALTFLCLEIMEDAMCSIIIESGGEVHALDRRNYGVVITARKVQSSTGLPLFSPSP